MSLNWEAYSKCSFDDWLTVVFPSFFTEIDSDLDWITLDIGMSGAMIQLPHVWKTSTELIQTIHKTHNTQYTQYTSSHTINTIHTIHMLTHNHTQVTYLQTLFEFDYICTNSKHKQDIESNNQYIWDQEKSLRQMQRPLCFIRCCNWRLTLRSWAGNIAIVQ